MRGATETGKTTQVIVCAATWLAWVARCMDEVTDIPGGASASGRRVHAMGREVQAVLVWPIKRLKLKRPCPLTGNAETCLAQRAMSCC